METKHNEWEAFFDRHAPQYMENVFTKNTLEEVDFILEELDLPIGNRILDIGCGTGRHSIELARRGYSMTGVDISRGMLDEARHGAVKAGVNIDLVHQDAVAFDAEEEFDAAICLCEGAFGLLGTLDDPFMHDVEILKNIHRALNPNGKLILTALNGMRKIREATEETIVAGHFDPLTLMENYSLDPEDPGGEDVVQVRERGFVPSELVLMLRIAGFTVLHVWGGTAGAWRRKPVDLDEMEIMVSAQKGK
jgi:cyclopropane fatty-acyl-phospholipid synthase-like methyltransferase